MSIARTVDKLLPFPAEGLAVRATSFLFEAGDLRYARLLMSVTRILCATAFLLLVAKTPLLGNGGAWQTGVPVTGNGAASDQKRSTNVTIENENLVIDLHQEFAAVEVRYRMRNTGAEVEQDFFFPVERWANTETEAVENTATDLLDYTISVDGTKLKSEKVEAKGEQPKAVVDSKWGEFKPATRFWKKSRIPFARGQTRDVLIRYRSPYAANENSVSEDAEVTDAYFRYSLSPAATWKGPIGKGKITVNYLHPRPEEIVIAKPKDQFKKISETQLVWEFHDLKPTLDDDIKIIVHPGYATNPAYAEHPDSDHPRFRGDYITQGNQYFLQHTDYEAVASSTLAAKGEHKYDVANIKGLETDASWVEGAEGDGIGENIALKVNRPLELDALMIMPGYRAQDATLWSKNNRVAQLEVTLNGEQTFVVAIPDEKFENAYPIPVRAYAKPVNTVNLVIKAVHRGTGAHDTCISRVELRAKLSKKPEIRPAR